jgi:hypothetical protein
MSLCGATCILPINLKMRVDALNDSNVNKKKMKENFLRLECLSRNKDHDYRVGQLMLLVF